MEWPLLHLEDVIPQPLKTDLQTVTKEPSRIFALLEGEQYDVGTFLQRWIVGISKGSIYEKGRRRRMSRNEISSRMIQPFDLNWSEQNLSRKLLMVLKLFGDVSSNLLYTKTIPKLSQCHKETSRLPISGKYSGSTLPSCDGPGEETSGM